MVALAWSKRWGGIQSRYSANCALDWFDPKTRVHPERKAAAASLYPPAAEMSVEPFTNVRTTAEAENSRVQTAMYLSAAPRALAVNFLANSSPGNEASR